MANKLQKKAIILRTKREWFALVLSLDFFLRHIFLMLQIIQIHCVFKTPSNLSISFIIY
jgi:hypothetical protein